MNESGKIDIKLTPIKLTPEKNVLYEEGSSSKKTKRRSINIGKKFGSAKNLFKRDALKQSRKKLTKRSKAYQKQTQTLEKRINKEINFINDKANKQIAILKKLNSPYEKYINEYEKTVTELEGNIKNIERELLEYQKDKEKIVSKRVIDDEDTAMPLKGPRKNFQRQLAAKRAELKKFKTEAEAYKKRNLVKSSGYRSDYKIKIPKEYRPLLGNKKQATYDDIKAQIGKINDNKTETIDALNQLKAKQQDVINKFAQISETIVNAKDIKRKEDPNYKTALAVNKNAASALKRILESDSLTHSIKIWNQFVVNNQDNINDLKPKHFKVNEISTEHELFDADTEDSASFNPWDTYYRDNIALGDFAHLSENIDAPKNIKELFNRKEKFVDTVRKMPKWAFVALIPTVIGPIIFGGPLLAIWLATRAYTNHNVKAYEKDIDYLNNSLVSLTDQQKILSLDLEEDLFSTQTDEETTETET